MSSSRPTSFCRPWTASRPTTTHIQPEGNHVIALLEGRGVSRETGIAALNRDTGQVTLVQVADCPTYVKTLHQMHLHYPSTVLVPDTFLSASDAAFSTSGKRSGSTSLLVEYVLEEFPNAQIEPVGRRYWNDNGGLEFILQLCVENDERAGTILAVGDKYYALSAACALFKYYEAKMNTRFAAASLRIRYVPVEGTMMIDRDTARNLELVGNMTFKKSPHSLFGYTSVEASIHARLDAVEELINSEDRFNYVRDALKALNKLDLDKLIITLASSEAKENVKAKPASQRVSQMLSLRNVVAQVPVLKKALEGCRSTLLRILCEMISDERLVLIERLVNANLNEETGLSKGGIGAINSRVYALLDVARETYKENVGDIYELNHSLSEQHDLPLVLVIKITEGLYSRSRKINWKENFRRVYQRDSQEGQKKMNARMKDALDETLLLSDKIIQDLTAEVINHVGALYKASEAVRHLFSPFINPTLNVIDALVDMLWSFATPLSVRLRPEFTGTLAIKSGRHPVLETVQAAGTVVANDVYCDASSLFQIIQGPNTYLRQIGLLAVMAMCGCFVACRICELQVYDALLTQLSTFANEMTCSAMILGLATPNTLVLMMSLDEGPLRERSCVFFATHFSELTTTLSRQPSVVNLHLSFQRSRQTASNFGMTFRYKILDGVSEHFSHYGLELARLADLPADVLEEGKNGHEEESETSKIFLSRKVLLKTQLKQAHDHSALPDDALLDYIRRFHTEIAKAFIDL
ncbi:DNA mismatch repair protein MutS [Coprinopsis sp. MPI-PUGE-AT-0042]|nr:DNA mismatch repair protein MutS [Coprinopsis sp. MPI-PUGE-AT-0042]